MSSRSASARPISCVAPDWWDYTTLDPELVADAAALTPEKMQRLSRPGFKVTFYDTLEEFYLAEALEYVAAWKQSTDDNPVGICGPIGPTEQLPLVARIVNALGLDIRSGHFWGMDEWVIDGKEAPATHPCPSKRPTGNCASTASPANRSCPTHTCISPRPTPEPIERLGIPESAAPSCKAARVT